MAKVIHEITLNPSIAIARLGSSSQPVESYHWSRPENPRWNGETNIYPDWTLKVAPDGSVHPELPSEIHLRDGLAIRPVAPFFELFALTGEENDKQDKWTAEPLSIEMLRNYVDSNFKQDPLSALSLKITAINRKAARRTGNKELEYGTFPSITTNFNNFDQINIRAVSPPNARVPLIPIDREISFGSLQIIRPRPQPASGLYEWSDLLRVDVIRFRYTPAKGKFYGPPDSSRTRKLPQPWEDKSYPAVPLENAFLNPNAGWYGTNGNNSGFVEPADTFDGAENEDFLALGVIDDTCDIKVEITLRLPPIDANGDGVKRCHCNIWVGPPDFSPDRRPFLSISDEINDRAEIEDINNRNKMLSNDELNEWVQDLFERVYEVVSIFNVDYWRNRRAQKLTTSQMDLAIPNDQIGKDEAVARAMSSVDKLRNRDYALNAASEEIKLPLFEHARTRHRALSDIESIIRFVIQHPGRLKQLIRKSFSIGDGETSIQTSMQMPPFMRQSNAMPLTLSSWQYDLLIEWVDKIETSAKYNTFSLNIDSVVLTPISDRAKKRRESILNHLGVSTGSDNGH